MGMPANDPNRRPGELPFRAVSVMPVSLGDAAY